MKLLNDLKRLNTLTKYPSIPTYHKMGGRGTLSEEREIPPRKVFGTEKVDGTNTRIILFQKRKLPFIIGSREELLYAEGDRIGNPALGIVDAVKSIACHLKGAMDPDSSLLVFYLETFGGKVTANSKQYTGERKVDVRLFDIAEIPVHEAVYNCTLDQLSGKRERREYQKYWTVEELDEISWMCPFLKHAPHVFDGMLPESHEDVYTWLQEVMSKTQCALDENAGGKPEGVVVRSEDRSFIAKIRYDDYRRTLQRKGKL